MVRSISAWRKWLAWHNCRSTVSLGERICPRTFPENMELLNRVSLTLGTTSKYSILLTASSWTSILAWQSGNAIGVFIVSTLIQSIISINIPTYSFPPWHATLLVIGAVAVALAGNVFGSKFLGHWQIGVFVIHVIAYFAFINPIWVNAPRATSTQVWTGFENSGVGVVSHSP